MLAWVELKLGGSAPFRLRVRSTNSQAGEPLSPLDGAPNSHLLRRRGGSDSRIEAVTGKRREESSPPTKPSIAPPSPRPAPKESALGDASPLIQLERAAPTLTYGVVIGLAAAALGLGALMAAWSGGRQGATWFAGTLLFIAVSTLIFSASMAVVITLSFTRRLRVLSEAAWGLARAKSDPAPAAPSADALTSLAHSVTCMAERIAQLGAELEQLVEEEQARVDELVRERTRALAREAEDYRRMVGETKGLLTLDRDGHVVAQSSLLEAWLGAMPRSVQFWEYFDRQSQGMGERFESAWARALAPELPEPDLASMPASLAVGARHFTLEYKGVLDGLGKLDRVLVLVTDVSIPAPDPATTSRAR